MRSNVNLITVLLGFLIWLTMLGCPPDPNLQVPEPELEINIFYDISASMDGLLYQPTQAISDIRLIGNQLGRNNRVVNFYALSDTLSKKMSADTIWNQFGHIGDRQQNWGNTTASRLDSMVGMVRKNTHKGQVSLLITDGIYSLGIRDIQNYYRNHRNNDNRFIEALLREEETNLGREFNALADNGFALKIYRFLSDFEQSPRTPYYNFKDNLVDPTSRHNRRRRIQNEVYPNFPWYIIAIGKEDDIKRFTLPFPSRSEVMLELPTMVVVGVPTPYMKDDYSKNVDIKNDTLVVMDPSKPCSFGVAINLTEKELLRDGLNDLGRITDVVDVNDQEKDAFFRGSSNRGLNDILDRATHVVIFSNQPVPKGDKIKIEIPLPTPNISYFETISLDNDLNGPEPYKTFGFDRLINAAILSYTRNETLMQGVLIIPFKRKKK